MFLKVRHIARINWSRNTTLSFLSILLPEQLGVDLKANVILGIFFFM